MIKSAINGIETHAHTLQAPLAVLIEDKGMSKADASKELGAISSGILVLLQEVFPPPDHAPSHKQRREMVKFALTKFEDGFTGLLRTLGLPDSELSAFHTTWGQLSPHITMLIVTIGETLSLFCHASEANRVSPGDLIEQHPLLFASIMSFVLTQLHFENLITRALLRIFGFSPLGPVKG